MNKRLALLGVPAILAFLLSASALAGEVRVLVVIEDPSGGTFRVRDGYVIDIIAASATLGEVQVTVTDYVLKLAVQPRPIPGSDPPAATFRFNATELKGCCGGE